MVINHRWIKDKFRPIMLLLFVYDFLNALTKQINFLLQGNAMEGGNILVLSVIGTIVLGFVFLQRYWFASCTFLLINELLKFLIVRPFTVGRTIIGARNYDMAIWVALIGILCLGVSLVFFIKFIRLRNYKDYYLLKDD
ncbi:MAG: hypothetical protein M1497_13855 [Nitrospirae bacterium]|nr:hypothetical protein [Nitrospirota bacterium]